MLAVRQHPLEALEAVLQPFAPERTVAQTAPWLQFLIETQQATPVLLELHTNGTPVGGFVGAVVRKLGFRILGSPFAGWTTAYMGLCLAPSTDRVAALRAVLRHAYHELGVLHVELLDRHLSTAAAQAAGFAFRTLGTYEIDLGLPEDEIFGGMTSACRTCVRKAEKSGVVIEEAAEHDRFTDLYCDMLNDVFRGQGLAPTYNRTRVARLIANLHPAGNLLLLLARNRDGHPIAAGIFPAGFGCMYLWGNASYHAETHVRPNELLHWHALRHWKARGMARYDMGGGGEYKKKYGGKWIEVPWIMAPRYRGLLAARAAAQAGVRVIQRLRRAAGRAPGPAEGG